MAVIEVETIGRETYADGRDFSDTGAYERIDGVLTFAVDPDHGANQPIVDLGLAPRDSAGRVRFWSDVTLLVPKEPDRGNGRLIVDVVNRGRKMAVSNFNRAPAQVGGSREVPEGDGFLFDRGYSVVSIGWQWDVYGSEALLGLQAPAAEMEGRPVRGQTSVEIRPNVVERTRLLADRVHRPYPVADPDDVDAVLLVRDWEDGPDTVVPRSLWRFAREADDSVAASREHIYLYSGFQPGKIYHVVYTAEGAVVVGTGLLAVRDVASWLRHPSDINPVTGGFERVYGYGISQTGRLLRHFVYLGLNLDEEGRPAYDGLLPHVAGGRRGQFNNRFGQPSVQSAPGFGHRFPFADDEMADALTERNDGLLRRQRELGAVPKIVYTNSSAEYWRGDGSLTHIDGGGRRDLGPADETRIYHFAGTQHGAGSLPQAREGGSSDGSVGRYPLNVVDYTPLLRAALVNLDRWVSDGTEPPPSRHLRLGDKTAVARGEALASFNVPGVETPDSERLWVLREVDLGPEAGHGIGRYPMREGRVYPCFVSALDGDGNEVAGIRLPDLTVPVGTHTGWNPRAPETGAPEQIVPMQGFSTFFAATAQARKDAGDDRPSLEERYVSREAYLGRVREEAQRLAAERYLLEEDVEIVVSACAERYDLVAASTTTVVDSARHQESPPAHERS